MAIASGLHRIDEPPKRKQGARKPAKQKGGAF
jgi:hypothetical protein